MELKFLRNVLGIYNTQFKEGEIKKYYPWHFIWHGMTESERVNNGIFLECAGQGEFDIFYENKDVEVLK